MSSINNYNNQTEPHFLNQTERNSFWNQTEMKKSIPHIPIQNLLELLTAESVA